MPVFSSSQISSPAWVSGELPELLLLLATQGAPWLLCPTGHPIIQPQQHPKYTSLNPKTTLKMICTDVFLFLFHFFDQNLLTFQTSVILFPLKPSLLRIRTTINIYLIFFTHWQQLNFWATSGLKSPEVKCLSDFIPLFAALLWFSQPQCCLKHLALRTIITFWKLKWWVCLVLKGKPGKWTSPLSEKHLYLKPQVNLILTGTVLPDQYISQGKSLPGC